jgi:hypothetical protein
MEFIADDAFDSLGEKDGVFLPTRLNADNQQLFDKDLNGDNHGVGMGIQT